MDALPPNSSNIKYSLWYHNQLCCFLLVSHGTFMISACNEHTTNCNDCVDYAEKCDGCSAPYHPAMDDLFCGGMCSLRTTVASQQMCPLVPLITIDVDL